MLGFAYLQKARESGDPTFYTKADGIFERGVAIDPRDSSALLGASAVAAARHDFQRALERAQSALEAAPGDPDAYGAVGDALIELGRYDEAGGTLQEMLDARPDLNAYVRVAYARELHGDIEGAVEAIRLAVEASRPGGETTAWVRSQLGNLYFNNGALDEAALQYEASLETFPGYVHALAGLARVAAARGEYDQAIEAYEQIVARQPILEHVAALGDTYAAAGRDADAQRQYDLVAAIDDLYRANSINTDLEMALFLADHPSTEGGIEDAVSQAHAAYAAQPGSIRAADVLSWALYKAGNLDEALRHSNEALRLGTHDPLLFFHAGMINHGLANDEVAADHLARALEINPRFSVLYAGEAEATLKTLRSSVRR
jgi:tetratricopeptide (TPR) repeat protein